MVSTIAVLPKSLSNAISLSSPHAIPTAALTSSSSLIEMHSDSAIRRFGFIKEPVERNINAIHIRSEKTHHRMMAYLRFFRIEETSLIFIYFTFAVK